MSESQLHEVYTLVSQVKLIKNITARLPWWGDDCLRWRYRLTHVDMRWRFPVVMIPCDDDVCVESWDTKREHARTCESDWVRKKGGGGRERPQIDHVTDTLLMKTDYDHTARTHATAIVRIKERGRVRASDRQGKRESGKEGRKGADTMARAHTQIANALFKTRVSTLDPWNRMLNYYTLC
jgi:hypothetical protein